jgi:HK97 family phage major capsid protein
MNKAILFEVAAFKDTGGRYVFNPQTAPGVPQNILGYPIVEAEDMQSKSANNFPVAFGSFSDGYLIVDRFGTRLLRDPFSNKPYIGFYATKRVGGCVTNSEAIKLIKFAVS